MPMRQISSALAVCLSLSAAASAYASQAVTQRTSRDDAPVWPAASVYEEAPVFIDTARVFESPIADPRWPRLSSFYNYYTDDEFLGHMGTVGLGESVALYRDVTDGGNLWEVGLQGVVYGVYDVGSGNDLYNTDWLFGAYYAYRRGDLSILVRTYHDSGHLGDEFVINNPEIERENFVLDGGQILLSQDVSPSVRLYGGPAWYWSTSQHVHDSLLFQWGVELEAPHTIWNGTTRPVGGIDVQHWEGRDFRPDLSVRGGLRFEQPHRVGRNVSILGEFYNGRQRNGQFLDDNVQYFGIGLQFQL